MPKGTPDSPREPGLGHQSPDHHTHGYWGPLPGESPELYKTLGVPRVEEVILGLPKFWRGNFSFESGRDLEVRIPKERIVPPAELTRKKRLENFVEFTQKNEITHLGAFAVLSALSVGSVFEGGWLGVGFAALVGVVNTISTVPPILVQRYNRLRAYRLLDRMDGVHSTTASEQP